MIFRNQRLRNTLHLWAIFTVLTGVTSCSWLPCCKKKAPQPMGVISVRLKSPVPKRGLTYARGTVTKGKSQKVVAFQSVSKAGDAAFVLPMGKAYDVSIFCDLNRNEEPDPGEPIGFSGLTSPRPTTSTEDHTLLLDFGAKRTLGLAPAKTTPAIKSNPSGTGTPLPSTVQRHLDDLPPWMREAMSR